MVIKAQVQVGGRGKAGGVKLAEHGRGGVRRRRATFSALTIKGLPVRRVLVAQAGDIARELYLSIVLDREKKLPLIMLSAEGGVDIEEVARTAPDKIVTRHIPHVGAAAVRGARAVPAVLTDGRQVAQAADILMKLWRVYSEGDCSLAEINPLVVTPRGKVLALDAR